MTIWIDAQLSPALAAWVNRTYDDLQARSVRSLGLRDAEDAEIFRAAREAEVVVMSKDSDFLHLLDEHGPPPRIIWVTAGNTSNRRMREILSQVLPDAVEMLWGESRWLRLEAGRRGSSIVQRGACLYASD